MPELSTIALLFLAGTLVLILEIFIPSYGVLCVVGVGLLIAAIVKTFAYGGDTAGIIAIIACCIFLPTMAYVSVKYWRQTPIGRRIVPPNPVLTEADLASLTKLNALIGQTGKAVSPLRPVGICTFEGKRLSCVAEVGAVDAGVYVVAMGIKNGNLTVRPQVT